MSQIWALTVLPSTLMERVANSTPMVDLDSRLNSLRVNRESTAPRQMNPVDSACACLTHGYCGRVSNTADGVAQARVPLSYTRVPNEHNLFTPRVSRELAQNAEHKRTP